jgi:hypothetical protein
MSNTGFDFDNATGDITWMGMPIPLSALLIGGIYNCPIGVAVGDAVFLSAADNVDRSDASVVSDRPVIGFVHSKPTTTTCRVQYAGDLSVFVGLTVGATYYLDTTAGQITTTPPSGTGNIVQEVGFARNATTLVVQYDRDFTVVQ